MDKLLLLYNVPKTAKRAVATLSQYTDEFASFKQEFFGKVFFADKAVETFRPSDTRTQRDITRIHPEEIIAAARCAVETGLNMRRADVVKEVVNLFGGKKTKAVTEWIEKCLDLAIAENRIMLTVDDIMTT